MLRLEIIDGPPDQVGSSFTINDGDAGASVGRIDDCDWCLTDPSQQMSRRHCQVLYQRGKYLVEDTSTNGSFINDSHSPIGRGNQVELKDGDRLRIGEYVLRAHVQPLGMPAAEPAELGPLPGAARREREVAAGSGSSENEPAELAPESGEPFGDIEPAPLSQNLIPDAPPRRRGAAQFAGENEGGSGLDVPVSSRHDPRPIFDVGDSRGEALPESPRIPSSASPLTPQPAPPSAPPAPSVPVAPPGEVSSGASAPPHGGGSYIPEDYDLLAPDEPVATPEPGSHPAAPPPQPSPAPEPPPLPPTTTVPPPAPRPDQPAAPTATTAEPGDTARAAPRTDDSALQRALRSALGDIVDGMDEAALLRTVESLASIVAVMTPQLMAAVASRAQFKESLHLRRTLIRARENNPLKVSGDGTLALRRLILSNEPGMLHGREAVEEAFSELANHQAAMVAALKPALKTTLENLAPAAIEDRMPNSPLDRLPIAGRRSRLWSEYCDLYESLMQSEGRDIELRFLNALADQYDAAIAHLDR